MPGGVPGGLCLAADVGLSIPSHACPFREFLSSSPILGPAGIIPYLVALLLGCVGGVSQAILLCQSTSIHAFSTCMKL